MTDTEHPCPTCGGYLMAVEPDEEDEKNDGPREPGGRPIGLGGTEEKSNRHEDPSERDLRKRNEGGERGEGRD